MDVEKLIRRLRNDADAYRNGETLGRAFADQEDVLDNAATALSTLQAENEKLRGELEYEREHANAYHEECGQWEAENEKLRAELKQVKRERDGAQSLLAERIGVRGAEPITTVFGLPLDRLRELAQADRDGRCVVLPKDGMVYYIEEAGGEKWIGNKPIQQVVLRCGFGMALLEFSLFDTSKYFSRADAEAALRREQDG